MRGWNALIIAFATYSKIPMPNAEWTDENRKYSLCFFPAVGLAAALALGAWLWLCDWLALGAVLRGALGAVIPLLVTGGIHMDGFMDTMDAMASWQGRERRLEILKDSHTGAFAVIGCAAYLLALAGVLSEARASDAVLLGAVYVLSRALSASALTVLKKAKETGMLAAFARAAQGRAVLTACTAWCVLCVCLWAFAGGWAAVYVPAVAAVCLLAYRRMAYKHFGGVTGDLAGWFLQVTELACMAAVILGGKLL